MDADAVMALFRGRVVVVRGSFGCLERAMKEGR
jgi:hypothetical protein